MRDISYKFLKVILLVVLGCSTLALMLNPGYAVAVAIVLCGILYLSARSSHEVWKVDHEMMLSQLDKDDTNDG